MQDIFPDTVNGIDCVWETESQVFSYRIEDGVAIAVDFVDIHESKFNKFGRSQEFDPVGLTSESATYRLTVYPNENFYNTYRFLNPLAAMAVVIGIVFFVTVIFLFYDLAVRREFSAKEELLEARRRFVRYISHEVRTPLNAACIGLSLMQEEQAQAAGFSKAEELTAHLDQLEQPEQLPSARTTPNPAGRQHLSTSKIFDWFSLAQDILLNAQSSVDVLNDFLNFDKIESGNLALDLAVVSIFSLVESTVHEFQLSASKKKIQYNLQFERAMKDGIHEPVDFRVGWQQLQLEIPRVAVVGDAVRLRQVLRNLLSNALKFTPTGESVTTLVNYCPLKESDEVRHDEFYFGDEESKEPVSYTHLTLPTKA